MTLEFANPPPAAVHVYELVYAIPFLEYDEQENIKDISGLQVDCVVVVVVVVV